MLLLWKSLLVGNWRHLLSDSWTNSVVDMNFREGVLEFLTSVKLLDVYSFDQSKYLESISETSWLRLEQDAKYFWIFRNLDYKKWVQSGGEAKILGLRGPSGGGLESVASHIVQSLQNPDAAGQEGEVLYFFYNSTRHGQGRHHIVGWPDLVCVWTLLRQLIENRSGDTEQLLQTFLRCALDFLPGDEVSKLRIYSDPTETLRSLLSLSKSQDLWDALGKVLGDSKDPENPREQDLTLVIDLGSVDSAWGELVDNIRGMTAGLPRGYGTVRILLSNLPETRNLWQHRPFEILLEYDKERKGMYNPQTQPCLRH